MGQLLCSGAESLDHKLFEPRAVSAVIFESCFLFSSEITRESQKQFVVHFSFKGFFPPGKKEIPQVF